MKLDQYILNIVPVIGEDCLYKESNLINTDNQITNAKCCIVSGLLDSLDNVNNIIDNVVNCESDYFHLMDFNDLSNLLSYNCYYTNKESILILLNDLKETFENSSEISKHF